MGQPRGAVEVTWGRSNVTGLAHAFWIDDDTVDAETSICGRASRLVVERIWFTAERPGHVPAACCAGCELMLQPKGARLELDHHREAKASRRLERQAEHDAADEQE